MSKLESLELDLDDLVARRRQRFSGQRQKLDRILQLMRTYPPRQVLQRVIRTGKKKLGFRYRPNIEAFDAAVGSLKSFAQLSGLSDRKPAQNEVFQGSLSLLNEEQQVGFPIAWRCDLPSQPSHLWRFQLHYHEWLLPLFETAPDVVTQIIEHWLECNRIEDPATHDDAWHPYCISRRLPVWMKLIAMGGGETQPAIVDSMLLQTDFLAHNLETDLRGNHLLENYHALAMAGCFFNGETASQWRAKSLAGLESELEYQILSSGEHYERSPMYQCVICGNLLQLAIVSRGVDEQLSQLAIQYAQRMLAFLSSILCPDGEIPLLSDSCFGEGLSIEELRRFANELGIDVSDPSEVASTKTVGDYWVSRNNKNMLLFDAGDLAAKGLPGHAHCDLLNVVGSVNGARLLVDSGNGSYNLDPVRAYCRSSVAHNVTTVDNIDHADVWSKFRMGFRGKPSGFKHGSKGSLDWAIAQHDAYRHCGIPVAKRMVISGRSGLLWVCIDYLDKSAKQSQLLEGFLHFDKSVALSTLAQDSVFAASNDLAKLRIGFLGSDKVQIGKSWQCSEFGQCSRNYAVVYSKVADTSQAVIGWYLCDLESSSSVELVSASSSEITVLFDDHEHHFDLMNC